MKPAPYLFGCCAAACLLVGCGTPPRASIGDPQIYTIPQVVDAQRNIPVYSRLDERLHQFFGKTDAEYKLSRLRVDRMLDSTQRLSAFAQQVTTLTKLSLAANLINASAAAAVASTESDGDTDSGGAEFDNKTEINPGDLEKILATVDRLMDDVVERTEDAGPADSPFDQLDRVTDFYTALLLKYLRRVPDGRSLAHIGLGSGGHGPALRDLYTAGAGAASPDLTDIERHVADHHRPMYRTVMLVLQAHVDPGSRENQMTGLRARVTGGVKTGGAFSPDDVKIVRIHPARTYDLDDTNLAEAFDQTLDLALRISAPIKAGDIDAAVDREVNRRNQARRMFLSRVNKQTSFVSAAEHEFGWNFYPSNLAIVEPNVGEVVLGNLFGTPSAYLTRSQLDGGGRDCAVFLLVDSRVTSIEVALSSFHSGIDRREPHTLERSDPQALGAITIPLPAYSGLEAVNLAGATDPGVNAAVAGVTHITAADAQKAGLIEQGLRAAVAEAEALKKSIEAAEKAVAAAKKAMDDAVAAKAEAEAELVKLKKQTPKPDAAIIKAAEDKAEQAEKELKAKTAAHGSAEKALNGHKTKLKKTVTEVADATAKRWNRLGDTFNRLNGQGLNLHARTEELAKEATKLVKAAQSKINTPNPPSAAELATAIEAVWIAQHAGLAAAEGDRITYEFEGVVGAAKSKIIGMLTELGDDADAARKAVENTDYRIKRH